MSSHSHRIALDLTDRAHDLLLAQARQSGQGMGQIVSSLVEQRLDYDAWFLAEVQKGLDDERAGRLLTAEESEQRSRARIEMIHRHADLQHPEG